MRITMDRNMCGSWAPACEECFGVFVSRGFSPDRACITEIVDDGSPDAHIVLQSGQHVGTLTITPENREAVISEGWTAFSTLPDEAFDIQPPHGDYVREKAQRS